MHPLGSSPTPIRTILLTGFMGAGKTTVGRLLAQRLGWEFFDLDHEIERQAGCSVAAIFATLGEPAFRQQETAALATLLARPGSVIALGGGAIETAANRELLQAHPDHRLVYLAAPLEALLARCAAQPQAAVRPLLADRDRLQARWTARLPYYEQAHLRIETNTLTPEAVAAKIAAVLRDPTSASPTE
jgi:shikimate kinase